MDESQEDLSLGEFNLIDNIIESAVDELILKKNSVHCVGLFAQVCRLCACDDQQMMHISDVHLQIIYDLQIPGINESIGCTNICRECNGFLEEFCKFRSQCEEGQKRISAMLGERKMLTEYVDSSETTENVPSSAMSDHNCSAAENTNSKANCSESAPEIHKMEMTYEKQHITTRTENTDVLLENLNIASTESPVSGYFPLKNPPRRAARIALELVKSLESSEGDDSEDESCRSEDDNTLDGYKENSVVSPVSCAKKSRANKISSTAVKAVIREPKRAESRRRVVDGHLQWVCLDCEQVFKSCMRLKKHRRTCVLVGSERSKRFGTNVCDLCGAVLSSTLAFKLHRRAHESATDTSCKQQLSSTQLEPFVCHVCGNLCKSSRVLRLHLLTHNAERNVECNICGKQFKRKRSLRVHLQVHSGTKFECEICSKKFLTTVTLSKHMKTHRIDYLKHSCTMCPKRFALLRQLQKHMMIHTGEYAHVCEICNARFRTAGRFNRHMQKGHVLPVHLNIVEQNDMNTLDDLIEYQPELTPTDLIQSNFEELTQPLPLPSRELLQEDAGFGSEELLDQASRIFTVQCFPNASFSDDTLYSFMD